MVLGSGTHRRSVDRAGVMGGEVGLADDRGGLHRRIDAVSEEVGETSSVAACCMGLVGDAVFADEGVVGGLVGLGRVRMVEASRMLVSRGFDGHPQPAKIRRARALSRPAWYLARRRRIWRLHGRSGIVRVGRGMDGGVAGGVVIDLGRDWSVAYDARPARPGWVRALVVALLLLLTLALAGDGEPVGSAFMALAAVPIAEPGVIALSPDRVFVADGADRVIAGRTWHGLVAAYPLTGPSPRWRTRIPEVPQELRFVAAAGVVIAVTYDGGADAVRMVALDAGTGRLLWSSASAVFAHAPAGSAEGLLDDQTAAGALVRWVDLRTGRTIWSRAVPAGGTTNLLTGGSVSDPAWVLMIRPDGADELVAEQTGAVFTNDQLGNLHPPTEQSGGGESDGTGGAQRIPNQVNVVGGRVLVLRTPDQHPAVLAAFDLATFTPRWTLTGDFDGYPNVCGPMICLASEDALTAVDPATGAVAWRAGGWQAGQMIDGDHLLARADQGDTMMGLLDVRTGRVLMRMSGWTPLSDPATGPTGLVVRPDTRQDGRFWFATLDPRHGAPSPLGDLSGLLSPDCQTTGDLLACVTLHGTVQIWRFRT